MHTHTHTMDSLSRTAYLDAFSNDPPATVGKLLSNRLGAAGEVNERLAEYFAERAEVGGKGGGGIGVMG